MKNARVAIIGGGPAGSTVGTLIKRYKPKMEVLIFEREKFPRDHIGESQLPAICPVLEEMQVWDKVEAANFPIKVGGTYRWGDKDQLWDLEFIPEEEFVHEPRPAKFQGQRTRTAFQVDRSIYDKILLDNAAEHGCIVREETKVAKVNREGDRVTSLVLENGEVIEADYYVDASGHSGLLRRTMGVDVQVPTTLKNVAFWDYWRNAEWAVEIGVGGTRIQVMSLGYGWLWFIPLGPDRTSLGLVVPADYYKDSGKTPEELYMKAVNEDPIISKLVRNATREDKFTTTKDWSFVADRLCGENWFLAGEAAGFADPILSAGLTLAHVGGRHLAHVIVALERKSHDPQWLKDFYDTNHRAGIMQHIRFADFWYTANGVFEDLLDYTKEIAKDAGLELSSDKAWQWLGTGGFTHGSPVLASLGGFTITAVKQLMQQFTHTTADWNVAKNNVFRLNLDNAEHLEFPVMAEGRIFVEWAYRRGTALLPCTGFYRVVTEALQRSQRLPEILNHLANAAKQVEATNPYFTFDEALDISVQTLEAMVCEGWVDASYNEKLPLLKYHTPEETAGIHWARTPRLEQPAAEA